MNRRPATDEGSVLVMALAFLSLFGLAIAAFLTFADTGFRTAGSVHITSERQYAADAAIEGAINAIRGDVAIGKDGESRNCFSTVLAAGAQVNVTPVSVTCLGRSGSGGSTGGAGGGSAPANSILTLPASTAEGVVLSAGAAPLVSGNVLTNQTRSVPAGANLTVQGSLTCRAVTGTGTVTATTSNCPAPAPAPTAVDPAYPPAIVSTPATVTAPTCPVGATATFAPGRYASAVALNALTDGSCANKRFHFPAGVYYFEFLDAVPPGTHQWLINDSTAEVVGGTLTATAFPNRCDLASAGVQFIFGADSRLAVTAGSLELCPPLSADQRISVYGPRANTPDIVAPLTTFTATTATSTAVAPETATFTPPGAGRIIGDGVEARFGATGNKYVGALDLTGFSTTAVPANAVITSARIRLAARSENQPFANTPTLTVTAGDGTVVSYVASPCALPCAMGTVSTIDVLLQINSPARANGLSLRYEAKDKAGFPFYISYFDGAAFDVEYTIPGLKATSGAAVAVPYSPATLVTTNAVLRGTGGAAARMAIKGTVYAPIGAVDLSLTGQLNTVAQRGITARTLQLGLTAGAAYTGPLIALPGTANRAVLVTASIGGVPQVRADVTFADDTPGATVGVTRWSVLR